MSAAAPHPLCSRFTLSGSPAGALEVEMEEGTNRSPSRDPLTPEPQDPAPKKKKKKRAATIGNNLFMTNMWRPNPLHSYGSSRNILERALPCCSGDITWNQSQCSGDQGSKVCPQHDTIISCELQVSAIFTHCCILLTKLCHGRWFHQIRIWSMLMFPTVTQMSRLQTEKK